ncbi:MAG: PAM68 family protein [Synechococcus sp.]
MARRKSKKKSKGSQGLRKNSKPLPFEVSQQSGSAPDVASEVTPSAEKQAGGTASQTSTDRAEAEATASNYIPPEVSKRMLRRAVWLAGVPTTLGMSAFFINYFLLVKHIVELPTWLTYVETLSLFGLGFVGLSYGVLSASWEPDREGGLIGLSEFRFNVAIMFQQWREHRQGKHPQQAED